MWFLYYALADTPAAAKRAGQNFKPEVILQTSTQNFQNSANYCAFEGVVANYLHLTELSRQGCDESPLHVDRAVRFPLRKHLCG